MRISGNQNSFKFISSFKKAKTKQTTRTEIESKKWRSQGGLSVGRGWNGGKGTRIKQHKQQVHNRQKEVKNSIGKVEVKELISMIHGHELRWVGMWVGRGVQGGGE